jgi:hypothetical protein
MNADKTQIKENRPRINAKATNHCWFLIHSFAKFAASSFDLRPSAEICGAVFADCQLLSAPEKTFPPIFVSH